MKNIIRWAILCLIAIVFTTNADAQVLWRDGYSTPYAMQSCIKDNSGHYFIAEALYNDYYDKINIIEINQSGATINNFTVPLKSDNIMLSFNPKNNTIYLVEMGNSNITVQSLNPGNGLITNLTSVNTLPGFVTVRNAITDAQGTLYICGNTINTNTAPYTKNGFLYKITSDAMVTQSSFNDVVIDAYNLAFGDDDAIYISALVSHTPQPTSALIKLTSNLQTVWQNNLNQNGCQNMIYNSGSITLSSNEGLTEVSATKTTNWDTSLVNTNTLFTSLCNSQLLAVYNANAIYNSNPKTLMVYNNKMHLVNILSLTQNQSDYVQYADRDDNGDIILIGTVLSSTGDYDGIFAESISANSAYACDNATGLPPSINTPPQISIYPNPAYDNITINFQNPNSTATLLIYNVIGQQVMSKEITTATTTIPTASLSNGLYLIRVIDSEGNSYVVKEVVKN